ncbi:MAG: DNA translocase FtsK 4TM domain-containing protein, partial [Acidobacteria bacterium]|nr:DNA translocase FtsK 4TM domain-containing protein [Acidobacteriota bacterium]
MKVLGPTPHSRLNEIAGVVYLALAVAMVLSLVSYHPQDPSWNTATQTTQALNLIGQPGATFADFALQALGLAAFLLPVLVLLVAWKWIRCQPVESGLAKILGSVLLLVSLATVASLPPGWTVFGGTIQAGGVAGLLLARGLLGFLNLAGTLILLAVCLFVSLYLVSSFSLAALPAWLGAPLQWIHRFGEWWSDWRDARLARAADKAARKAEERAGSRASRKAVRQAAHAEPAVMPASANGMALAAAASVGSERYIGPVYQQPPWEEPEPVQIPIHALDAPPAPEPEPPPIVEAAELVPVEDPVLVTPPPRPRVRTPFKRPSTDLLNEPSGRPPFDSAELQEIAARIKSKFQEFNVLGSVVQINPGPVVTTFEFKPEAGIKYSRMTTLTEDLCLGLQAESILIERIPGKPTVGIEVPNRKREVISLRQVLESEEFRESPNRLTFSLGKDIAGRIKVSALESMPHLLIAGSTGSGKSVMLNSLIMSVLYKSTPDEVRMIMVDPKRVELGIYEGIPHLLTPVITEPKKASNALRNAVLEMERRLKLLAAQGVRNVEQYNRKIARLKLEPRSLFPDDELAEEELQPLPCVLIIIDELSDLMMVERANVEESVCRLAQMARAVGMHLVLATQRPSVDVITGLIKANFPARISFRVATRVDSRTVLDVMGAEHLLGKGDMLFLPPGSSRLIRVHGALVTEAEINQVVDFWKEQAQPDYDETFLYSPDPEDDAEAELEGEADPMYADAVRVVCEMGKASTSTLQRRLRLGYGRAARILDRMQREGIIGPPDGSRPRDVLRHPDWL